MPLLLGAALIAVYVVLGMLYESLIHPFTILSTLPSAGVGALLALMAFQIDLSLVSFIGIILLMGIVKKNAIMMVDFAIEAERDEGLSPEEAIYKACVIRFRPIMMTTMARCSAPSRSPLASAPAPNCVNRSVSPSSAASSSPRPSRSTPRPSSISCSSTPACASMPGAIQKNPGPPPAC